MSTYTIYGKDNCAFCVKAKALLDQVKIPYDYVDLEKNPKTKTWLMSQGARTVPQVYRAGTLVGGYAELYEEVN